MSDQGPPQTSQAPGPPSSPLPTFRLHTPAVDFVENRMSQYHAAFDTSGLRYSPTRNLFVPVATGQSNLAPPPAPPSPPRPRPTPGSINHMSFWEEVFPEAMNQLNQDPLPYRGPYQPQWGIRHLTVWRDVQAKLDMARRDYEFRSGQQQVGKFRRGMRRAMDKAGAPLQLGRKLIPHMDITSPVLGVVDLLLDAYQQAAEVRETVNSGFDDLPDCFARIDFYIKSYPKDKNILVACVDLVHAVFRAIEEAVRFYTSAQAKRAGCAIVSGEEYQQKLLNSLQEIHARSKSLESHASMSFTHRMITGMSNLLLRKNVSIEGYSDESRRTHGTLLQDNWATHQALGVLIQEGANNQAGIVWVGNLINRALGILSDMEKNWPPSPSRPGTPLLRPSSPIPSHHHQPAWTPRHLWTLLRIPHLDERDTQHVLSPAAAGALLHEDRGRAEQVLSTPLFRAWLGAAGSARLLVHGDFDAVDDGVRGVSPLSVLCATVVRALRLRGSGLVAGGAGSGGGVISLVFFCGCHLVRDELWGGEVMIRSLLAQLLRQFPAAEIQPDPRVVVVEEAGTEELCGLFVYLVGQLPAMTTVYCLIDGINEYEREEYLHGMEVVVTALLALVDEGGPGRVKFKLLLMSPQPTVEVRQVFDDVPGALLHMGQLPMLEEGISFVRIQEQLGLVDAG